MKKLKLKISKDDIRIGNFVFHRETDFVKVYDINNSVSHRISTLTTKGRLLEMALEKKEKNERWLMNYAAVMFNALSCVPDADFFVDVNKAVEACLSRHKDLYGIKEDISPEEDARILEEQKDYHNAVEKLKEDAE